MGAYVQLLEYQNVEGMILLSELSKRRIRSVTKLIRVGRFEVCSVLRVDHEKGYIDLSKKRVSAEDAAQAEEWYARSKAVHSIMRHVSSQTNVPLVELCETMDTHVLGESHAKLPTIIVIFGQVLGTELVDDETRYTGCNYDNDLVWTATPCGDEHDPLASFVDALVDLGVDAA